MGYRREIYDYALNVIEERRSRSIAQQAQHREIALEKIPELEMLEREMNCTGFKIYKVVSDGTDVEQKIKEIERENLLLNQKYTSLLIENGFPIDYLEKHYYCKKCQDSGFVDGQQCECFMELLKQEASRRLNELTPMKLCDFSTFKLEYYSDIAQDNKPSPRSRMESIFKYCKNYAEYFTLSSPNLLMQGATGLGKTHLSLAIAKRAIELGYDVVYGSAYNLLNKLERERFGKDEDHDSYNHLVNCDLLILDDLGTEYTSAYVSATIQSIVNTRQLAGLPTIISTNLSMNEMLERYSDRIVSRILGSYERLLFAGKDVRLEMKKRRI